MLTIDNSGPRFSLPKHLAGDIRDVVLSGGSQSDRDRMQRPLRTQFDFWLLALLLAVREGYRPDRGLPDRRADAAIPMPAMQVVTGIFPQEAPSDVAKNGVRVHTDILTLLGALFVADHSAEIAEQLRSDDGPTLDVSSQAVISHLDRYAAAGSDLLLTKLRSEANMDELPYQTLTDMIIDLVDVEA